MNRSAAARVAAHTSWANTADRTSRTAATRAGLQARFERQARELLGPGASERQVLDVAESAGRAYFTRLAAKGVAARRAKR